MMWVSWGHPSFENLTYFAENPSSGRLNIPRHIKTCNTISALKISYRITALEWQGHDIEDAIGFSIDIDRLTNEDEMG